MRKDKQRIFQLRKEGRTYREIQRDTGVSRATLTKWFKGEPWSKHLAEEHAKKNRGASQERMDRMNMVRKLKLQYQYALVEADAKKEYEEYRTQTLFWAGLMIYAGEGDKVSRSLIRISSSEAYLHTIFIRFCLIYLGISINQIRIGLLLYSDHAEDICVKFWSAALGIPPVQFHKTQVIQGKERVRRLQYGVGMSIISSTSLKKKILQWISLAKKEQFQTDAIIV